LDDLVGQGRSERYGGAHVFPVLALINGADVVGCSDGFALPSSE
jgi:hypothetical protein